LTEGAQTFVGRLVLLVDHGEFADLPRSKKESEEKTCINDVEELFLNYRETRFDEL
jgi:hypothetical protein